jgi:hypothetical protein
MSGYVSKTASNSGENLRKVADWGILDAPGFRGILPLGKSVNLF